jgi:hypothetical protein
VVRQVLNLNPLDSDDDSDYNYDDIRIVGGALLGNDYVVYRVRRVLMNDMHVAVAIF